MSKKSKLAAIIATTGGVILISLVAVFLMGWAAIDANDDVLRYHVAIGQLREILSTLKDAETGQRGYLLTGEEKYLQPYQQAIGRVPQELEALTAKAKTGELSAGEITSLSQLTSQKLAELRQTIMIRRAQGLPAALAIVETDFGKNTMDSIRAEVAHINAQQEATLASANRRANQFVAVRNPGNRVKRPAEPRGAGLGLPAHQGRECRPGESRA